MKILLFLFAVISFSNLHAQYIEPQPDNSPKINYNAIIVYRTWSVHDIQNGDAISMQYGWDYTITGFNSVDEAIAWLNYKDYEGHPQVRLTELQLISIIDLTTSKKITVQLKAEEKSIPKHVEVEAEKWIEHHYEIKKP